MQLAVYSHKPVWKSEASDSGFATDGGFAFQMAALSELFDYTTVLVPVIKKARPAGEIALCGNRLRVVPLPPPYGTGWSRKALFPWWCIRCLPILLREFRAADGIHAPIPGDVGTVGMLMAWLTGKPLFVRHCGNWLRPVTVAERFWRWFMEKTAGQNRLMLATGGGTTPPSSLNRAVHWIFSSSLSQLEIDTLARVRKFPREEPIRLIIVARQEAPKGAGRIIESLPQLVERFTDLQLRIVGTGAALPSFRQKAHTLGVERHVHFCGQLNHFEVLEELKAAHLFVFPTQASDGFPKAVLEGLACGLPVVATRVSVLPTLLGAGAGILIDDGSPDSISAAVTSAFSDPTRYEAMSQQATRAAEQLSLENWRETIGLHLTKAWGSLRCPRQP